TEQLVSYGTAVVGPFAVSHQRDASMVARRNHTFHWLQPTTFIGHSRSARENSPCTGLRTRSDPQATPRRVESCEPGTFRACGSGVCVRSADGACTRCLAGSQRAGVIDAQPPPSS